MKQEQVGNQFVIMIKQDDTTITIEKTNSDIDIYEFGNMIITIAKGLGFSEATLAEILTQPSGFDEWL